MPNGDSHFRSALQHEEPSPCHTSDEEWVQAGKEAWPRPRILTLNTIWAWRTLVFRSQFATVLHRRRLMPRILLDHDPVIFDNLASFLAVPRTRPVVTWITKLRNLYQPAVFNNLLMVTTELQLPEAPAQAAEASSSSQSRTETPAVLYNLLTDGAETQPLEAPAQATEAPSSSQSRTETPAVLQILRTDGAEIQRCQCPRGCVATAEAGEAYCMQCYAQAGADFYIPPDKKYPPGVAPLEQPPCECPNPCCNPITASIWRDLWRASGEILVRASADPTASSSTLGPPTMQQAAASLTQLLRERAAPCHGGISAALEQRRLRTWCLSQTPKVFKVTMTHESWPWRELLRGMDRSKFRQVIQRDDTIMEFNFRLLSQLRDSNWRRHDTGERHVFEMLMRNGDAWHLHFHKRGTCDKLARWTLPDIVYERQCSLAATMGPTPQ